MSSSRRREVRTGRQHDTGAGAAASSANRDKVCEFFERSGDCRLGNNCPYIHIQAPARVVTTNTSSENNSRRVCRFFEKNGQCRDGDNCPFVHNAKPINVPQAAAQEPVTSQAKRVKCRYFKKFGTCKLGDECTFLHDTQPPASAKNSSSSASPTADANSKAAKVCRYFKKNGTCRDGANCAFSHDVTVPGKQNATLSQTPAPARASISANVEAPTKLCRYFSRSGSCKNGDSCKFLHRHQGDVPSPAVRASNNISAAAPQTKNDIHITADEDKKYTKLCRFFRHNECKLGSECPFIHLPNNSRPVGNAEERTNANTDKAVICKHFRRLGYCRLGDSCNFLHATNGSDLPSASTTAQAERNRDNRAGASTAVNTDAGTNTNTKQRICRYFKRFGACKLGSECTFLHQQAADRPSNQTASRPVVASASANGAATSSAGGAVNDKSAVPCRFFKKTGNCKLGSECRFAHNAPTQAKSANEGAQSSAQGKAQSVLCRYFSRNGSCKNGTACTFIHEQSQSPGQSQSQGRNRGPRARGSADRQPSRGRPRNRSDLIAFINKHSIPYVSSNGNSNGAANGANGTNGNSNGSGNSSMAKPFLENVLRNNSHKPGFLLEQYVSVVDADKVRILDEYRQPLCVGGFHLLSTTTNPEHNYVSLDPSFNCSFENSYLSVEYTHAQTQTQYRGRLVIGDEVSVPVDDLIATVSLLHDFLFSFVLSAYP